MRVFELLGHADAPLPPGGEEAAALYAAALEAYRQRRWAEALAIFEQALAACPGDAPSRAMAHRCRAFRRAPPAEGWDGSYDPSMGGLERSAGSA